jgi:Protein of unknown function (DUF559)
MDNVPCGIVQIADCEWKCSTMQMKGGHGDEAVVAALDRHDQRRRCGVPTISVLVGPTASAMQLVRQWAGKVSRSAVLVRPLERDPEFVVVPWVDAVAKDHDLRAAAVQWLARRLDRVADSLERSLRLMTPHEVAMFLDSVLPLESETQVERIGRSLIEGPAAATRSGSSGIAASLDLLLDGRGRPWVRVFRAMGDLVPLECLPVLVLSPAQQNVAGMNGIGRLLAELAVAQPGAALALLVERELFDSYAALVPVSRAKALLRESVINLPRPELLVAGGSLTALAESQEFISDDLESGILDLQSEKPALNDDQARSTAERFLYESLESVAETAGLFELNGMLDFHFGLNRCIEVDLLARTLKLAVEVDGYHHFTDPEAFRRDRRKDLELQKDGYLVVRVLADDVVERLEDVMNTIRAAVAFRRVQSISLEAK